MPLINYSQIRRLWLAILRNFYFTWFCIKFQEKSKNFKALAQKLQELGTKPLGGPALNRVNYLNGKSPSLGQSKVVNPHLIPRGDPRGFT